MKRTFSLLLSALLIIGLIGCSRQTPPAPTDDTGEALPVIYVRTGETAYLADGTPGNYKTICSYDDTGHLLSVSTDQGGGESVWDEELGVYLYNPLPYDGTIDSTATYTYDAMGFLTNYVSTFPGQEKDMTNASIRYTYGQNGLPEKLTYSTGGENAREQSRLFRYDEQNRLIRVEAALKEGDIQLVCDFTYDEAGRPGVACYHNMELIYQVQYLYDDDGRLTSMQTATAPYHLTHTDRIDFAPEMTTDFAYDKAGRLISRKNFDADGLLVASVVCSYLADGKQDSVCYFGPDGNLEDAFSYHYNGGQTSCTWSHSDDSAEGTILELLYDSTGNLIRRTGENGDYVEYSYKPLHVTEAQELQFHRSGFLRQQVDLDGRFTRFAFRYEPLCGFFTQIPYPESPLRETDSLRS